MDYIKDSLMSIGLFLLDNTLFYKQQITEFLAEPEPEFKLQTAILHEDDFQCELTGWEDYSSMWDFTEDQDAKMEFTYTYAGKEYKMVVERPSPITWPPYSGHELPDNTPAAPILYAETSGAEITDLVRQHMGPRYNFYWDLGVQTTLGAAFDLDELSIIDCDGMEHHYTRGDFLCVDTI